MRALVAYFLQLVVQAQVVLNLDAIERFSQDGYDRRVENEQDYDHCCCGVVASGLGWHVLAPSVDGPEPIAKRCDFYRDQCEADQLVVPGAHGRLFVGEHVHDQAVEGKEPDNAIGDAFLRVKDGLDDVRPLEIDTADGR